MTTRLAERLSAARHKQFVGRSRERDLFQQVLEAADEPFQVLHVFGPGGVGKTTLLREYAYLCEQRKLPHYYLDARNIDPAPESFLAALARAIGVEQRPLEVLNGDGVRSVIMIDTCEFLAPLDGWLRDVFLPQLPDNTIVVLAGRNAPSPEWRADPGWQTLIRAIPLRNLTPEEGRSYLARREVPPENHEAVLEFTHGHPLALSLVADSFAQRASLQFEPDANPDVVKTLLEQFVQKVPGPAHRAALEACALVRLTTESLLSAMLSMPDAHELFEWLRGLSFIEAGRQGIFPHDTAREALVADLRWRNPDWYGELHRRARTYYANRLTQTRGQEQQRVLFDYVFLHRDNPVMRPYLEWQETGSTMPDRMRPDDPGFLVDLVQRHEGAESRQWLEFWLARHPDAVIVYRDIEGKPIGFIMPLPLQALDPGDREADPATRAAWAYLARQAPMRSTSERATLFRFWMARDGYQSVSAVQSLIFGGAALHYLTTPGLAFSFFPVADVDFWAPMFFHVDLGRLPEAEFSIGGRHYGVFAHDWRVTPPAAWLALLAEREIGDSQAPATPPPTSEPLVVLSQPDFAASVREVLRQFTRPDALRGNPLLRSRLVVERAGAGSGPNDRVAALRDIVRDAAEALQSNPRQTKLYRAIYHTYLNPAATQEQAAELMDLPFSTYRRHLAAGITAIIDTWWEWELQGVRA